MSSAYDAVIVGAGLSGLTLAAHLAASPRSGRRVLIVDDGRHDVRARTWATWTPDPGWLSPAVSRTWQRFAVHSAGTSRTLTLGPYRYLTISGAQLQDLVTEHVGRAAHFEVVTGTVGSIDERLDDVLVTVDGTAVTACWVFDSRPPPVSASSPSMAFLGWELDADIDAFDPDVVTFMDFRGRRPGRLAFCYVLPVTARHALVEVAEFRWDAAEGRPKRLADDLTAYLTAYLQQVWGLTAWSVRRTEAGTLPLDGEPDRRPAGRVIPIGIRGGMLKPSTGFALDRIQRHSRALAAALADTDDPRIHRSARRPYRWMDTVFLDVLRRDPDLAETIFARLFARNSAPAVLRFLDEDASPTRVGHLAASLPLVPFVRAALTRRGVSAHA